MKTDSLIRVNTAVHQPLLIAMNIYERWSKIPFFLDMLDYLFTGIVISDPRYFAMGKIILKSKGDGQELPTLFVRCAVGDLLQLLRLIPCKLSQICFARRGKEEVQVYDMDRFLRLVLATKK